MSDPHVGVWERRRLLGVSTAVAGITLLPAFRPTPATAGGTTGGTTGSAGVAIPPTEDLMREHGVLKRVLLIYRDVGRRIRNGERPPPPALYESAQIIRRFIEQYHEHLEEHYVFPRLKKAGRLGRTVDILTTQHTRGRVLTARILTGATHAGLADPRTRRRVLAAMEAFIRMYEPHEAREDTVVFPAFRTVVSARELAELGERFEEQEHRLFGPHGFTRIVEQVADIERELGIYNLAQFTPRV